MNISSGSYHDFGAFTEMRRQAREADGSATKTVAKQFESLFVQMMLKEMRDALPEGGLLNDQTLRFYQDMMDKELSQSLVQGEGLGLAQIIERQLGLSPEGESLKHSLQGRKPDSSFRSLDR